MGCTIYYSIDDHAVLIWRGRELNQGYLAVTKLDFEAFKNIAEFLNITLSLVE